MNQPQALLGTILSGRYRVVKLLGSGGMGEVFLAEDLLGEHPEVALKTLRQDLVDVRTPADLRGEFVTMSQCHHPNLAQVHDFGVAEDGQCFFTMEYVRGHDLLAAARHMSPSEIVELVIQVCNGLHFLHSRGIVHFDVKPENILVTAPAAGTDSRAKLLDFGLASPEAQKAKGTVQYLAPELLRGEKGDHRADLYSLGLVLYELATGRSRFDARVPSSPAELQDMAAAFVPDMSGSRLPEEIDQVVLKLTASEPSARPGSAGEVAGLLTRALGERSGREDFDDVAAYVRGAELLGREEPLALLTGALDRRLKQRAHPPLMLIEGEVGVGKSRLLAEFGRECQLRGVVVVRAHCEESAPNAFEAVRGILRRLIAMTDALPKEARQCLHEHSAEVVTLVPELRNRGPVRQAQRLRPQDARSRMITSLAELIAELGRIRPFVLCVENVQWADEGTLEVLNRAGTMSYESGPLICCELRVGQPHSEAVVSFVREARAGRHTRTISLDLLNEGTMAQMVKSMFRSGQRLSEFAERVARESGGNPFFLEELVQYFVERGMISRPDGQWVFPDLADGDIDVPASVHSLLARRLGGLAPASRGVLEALAVHNYPATASQIARWTSLPLNQVVKTLGNLATLGLVSQTDHDPSMARISQPELQKTIYGLLAEDVRRTLHRQIGVAIEAEEGQDEENRLEPLARHFVLAGDAAKGLRYGLAAAKRLVDSYGHGRAVWFLESALNLMPRDAQMAAEGWEMLGDVFAFLGRGAGARRAFARALWQCKAVLRPADRARLHRKIGESYTLESSFARAMRMLQRANVLLEGNGTPEDEALVLWALGDLQHRQQKYKDAISTYQRGLAVLGENDSGPEAGYLYNRLGCAYRSLGDQVAAVAAYRKSIGIWQRLEEQGNVSRCLNNIGTVYVVRGDLDSAEQYFDRSLSIKRRIGLQQGYSATLQNLCLLSWQRGDFRRAVSYSRQAWEATARSGDLKGQAMTAYSLGALSFHLADYEQSLRDYWRGVRLIREYQPSLLASTLGGMGEVCVEVGFLGRAERLAQIGIQAARSMNDPLGEGFCLSVIAEARFRSGSMKEAADMLQTWRRLTEEAGDRKEVCSAVMRLAELALEQNELDAASELVEKAAEMAKQLRSTIHRVRAGIVQAKLAAQSPTYSEDQALALGRQAAMGAKAVDSPDLRWRAFFALATTHAKAGNWKYALYYFRRCADIIESIRSRMSRKRWRQIYAQSYAVRLIAAATEWLLERIGPESF